MTTIDYDEIIATVVERGALTRAELLEAWGLDTEQYAELRTRAKADPRVAPRQGRFGGIVSLTDAQTSEAADSSASESSTWPREELARVLSMLRNHRTMTRSQLYEEMDIDEPSQYQSFLTALDEYCDEEDHILDRKRGQGGVELKLSPSEVYEKLQAQPGVAIRTSELRKLSGQSKDNRLHDYPAFLNRLATLVEEDGRVLIRKKGATGVMLRPSAREVSQEILRAGHMTKSALIERLELKPGEYPQMVQSILEVAQSEGLPLQPAPGRAGGLELSQDPVSPNGSPEPLTDEADYQLQPWEQAAVEALSDIELPMLEQIVGPALYRTIRRLDSSRSRRSLATALVLRLGLDLFAEKDLRDALGKVRGVPSPGRWHPGGRAALEFVEAVGLPARFAGFKLEERKADIEQLAGRLNLRGLEDYQRSVQGQMLTALRKLNTKAMVSLPTGAGKTRVAVETIRDLLTEESPREGETAPRAVVLWLAHTEELCEQACACIRQVWEDSPQVVSASLVRFWGHYSTFSKKHEDIVAQLDNACVIVSTPQRLDNILHRGNVENPDLADLFVDRLRGRLRLILIDEAHRAAAPIYRRVFDAFRSPGIALLGLTATPFRNVGDPELGAAELKEIFERLIEPDRVGETTQPDSRTLRRALQERGVLAIPKFEEIETEVSLGAIDAGERPSLSEIEALDQKMARRADDPRRRELVAGRIEQVARDRSTSIIYFGPTVSDAEIMAYLLRRRGIAASVLSGTSKEATRRKVISDFKDGSVQVLCNCEVLTTGFDHPKITHVVIARPTMSQVLYEQMVGRGLRGTKFGGTSDCFVLDVVDRFPGGRRPVLGFDRFRDAWEATP